jgi:hypothetical protein
LAGSRRLHWQTDGGDRAVWRPNSCTGLRLGNAHRTLEATAFAAVADMCHALLNIKEFLHFD